jgi:hypothetical protein
MKRDGTKPAYATTPFVALQDKNKIFIRHEISRANL